MVQVRKDKKKHEQGLIAMQQGNKEKKNTQRKRWGEKKKT